MFGEVNLQHCPDTQRSQVSGSETTKLLTAAQEPANQRSVNPHPHPFHTNFPEPAPKLAPLKSTTPSPPTHSSHIQARELKVSQRDLQIHSTLLTRSGGESHHPHGHHSHGQEGSHTTQHGHHSHHSTTQHDHSHHSTRRYNGENLSKSTVEELLQVRRKVKTVPPLMLSSITPLNMVTHTTRQEGSHNSAATNAQQSRGKTRHHITFF